LICHLEARALSSGCGDFQNREEDCFNGANALEGTLKVGIFSPCIAKTQSVSWLPIVQHSRKKQEAARHVHKFRMSKGSAASNFSCRFSPHPKGNLK
jgi:hypothetical protein